MKRTFGLLAVFLVIGLQAEDMIWNLPEKFNVKVSKHWWTENGQKPTQSDAIREFNRPYTFYFDKNSFTFSDRKHLYSGGTWGRHYQSLKGEGTLKGNVLTGTVITKGLTYTSDNMLHFLWISHEQIRGQVAENGSIHLISKNIKTTSCQMRSNTKDGWGDLNNCDAATLGTLEGFFKNIKTHYLLQLPINQPPSSETFTPKPQVTLERDEPQQITATKENLSIDLSPTKERAKVEEESKPEEVYQDKYMREYLQREKERKAQEKDEEAKELITEQAEETQAKKDEAYKKMLDDWYEEDRQNNIKYNKKLEKEKAKRETTEREENKAFHDKIAEEQKERKDKQAEIKKAHDIINKFGSDYDEQRLSHKKVEELGQNADIEKSKAIKNAMRKQYYDSKQGKLQGKAEYQTAKAEEIDKKGKYVKSIKDTSLTVNKVLAKVDPTGVGEKIVEVQENVGDLINAAEEGGVEGVIVKTTSIVTNKLTNDIGGDVVEKTYKHINDYKKNGIQLDKDNKVYDKDGNRLTRYKQGDKVYDEKKNEISFSTGNSVIKNILFEVIDERNPIKKTENALTDIKDGVIEGDFNKAIGGGLDASDTINSVKGE